MPFLPENDLTGTTISDTFDTGTIEHIRERGEQRLAPSGSDAMTGALFPTADTWYMGAHIPGIGPYRVRCDEIADNDCEAAP